jgi:hypothetical protein
MLMAGFDCACSWTVLSSAKNMINKIDKERRRSMNAAPTRPSNKRKRQEAQKDPKEKLSSQPLARA